MKKQSNKTTITITAHAQQRLEERIGINMYSTYGYRSWSHMTKEARYSGMTLQTMPEVAYQYCCKHNLVNRMNNSSQVRLLNNYFFVFRGNGGHARTLVTVIKYEPEVIA